MVESISALIFISSKPKKDVVLFAQLFCCEFFTETFWSHRLRAVSTSAMAAMTAMAAMAIHTSVDSV